MRYKLVDQKPKTFVLVFETKQSQNELQSVRSIDGFARDVAEFLAAPPAPRGSLQEVQKNMPTRIAAMQPHCSSIIRSRSTSEIGRAHV